MGVSPSYCAQFTRKIRACYARVKKYTKLCVNKQILDSACKILHAEFRVKEGRIFTVVHQFVAAFSQRKCCMSNCPTGFRRMYSALHFNILAMCPLWLNNQSLGLNDSFCCHICGRLLNITACLAGSTRLRLFHFVYRCSG